MNIDFQNILIHINEQPEEIKKIIFSEKPALFLQKLANDNRIDEEKMYKITDLICYVLIGFIPKSEFGKILNDIIQESSLVEDINNKIEIEIFSSINQIIENKKIITVTSDNDLYQKIKILERNGDIKKQLEYIIDNKNFSQNNSDKKTIFDYLTSLPKNTIDLINDNIWVKRIEEICGKYSLTSEQATLLKNSMLFVLLGLELPEEFESSLGQELGISQLLAEQILKDLDTRVFQYAFDFISRNKSAEVPLPKLTGAFDVLDEQKSEKPKTEIEIAPDILPMKETPEDRWRPGAEIAAPLRSPVTNNIPANLPGIEISQPTSQTKNIPDVAGKTEEGTFVGKDFVQRPVAVPRFNVADYPEQPATQPKQQNPITVKPEVQNPPRYTVDPYREPIE